MLAKICNMGHTHLFLWSGKAAQILQCSYLGAQRSPHFQFNNRFSSLSNPDIQPPYATQHHFITSMNG